MSLMRWNEDYSVGVEEFDAQHRQLVGILNELHAAAEAPVDREALTGVVTRLEEYAATHLEFEERVLEREGYPAFAQHKAQHDAYVEKMKNVRERVASGKLEVSSDLIRFLDDWWTNHILKVDKQYAAFLRAKGVV